MTEEREMTAEEAAQAERDFHAAFPLHRPVSELRATMAAFKWRSITIYHDEEDPDIVPLPRLPQV